MFCRVCLTMMIVLDVLLSEMTEVVSTLHLASSNCCCSMFLLVYRFVSLELAAAHSSDQRLYALFLNLHLKLFNHSGCH